MQCHELENVLLQEPDGAMPPVVSQHLEGCAECRALAADLEAIRLGALELPAEEQPPARVWAHVRLQLQAEGLVREPQFEPAPRRTTVWSLFQRPAFAGSLLGILLLAAGWAGMRSHTNVSNFAAAEQPTIQPLQPEQSVEEASLNASETSIESLQQLDPNVQAVFKRDLTVVDNAISMCEKSVREQPENDLARESLNDAYQQKAQLLAVAMDRGTLGGR
jgi:hypothetical protein